MTSLNALIMATLFFVGGHFLLSSRVFRRPLISRLGPAGFQGLYALAALVTFIWMIKAYVNAPLVAIWDPPAALNWIPVVAMLPACILAVAGLSSPSPTMVWGERLMTGGTGSSVKGILTITRHPFLCGTTIWAASHLTVRGDLAGIIMIGGILALGVGGMWHIDQRREADLGGAWGPIKLTSSALPFGAALTGRTKIDWRGIGIVRPLAGTAIYVILLLSHGALLGVEALPV
jgi:uncharacterized membrane protein